MHVTDAHMDCMQVGFQWPRVVQRRLDMDGTLRNPVGSGPQARQRVPARCSPFVMLGAVVAALHGRHRFTAGDHGDPFDGRSHAFLRKIEYHFSGADQVAVTLVMGAQPQDVVVAQRPRGRDGRDVGGSSRVAGGQQGHQRSKVVDAWGNRGEHAFIFPGGRFEGGQTVHREKWLHDSVLG